MPCSKDLSRVDALTGRANKGSQKQIQAYVNEKETALNSAVAQSLARYKVGAEDIQWVSPLAKEKYSEYRDSEFLDRIGLIHLKEKLSDFWPRGGPCWDGLGRIEGGCVLVEAKSHISEIDCGGCKASPKSRPTIEHAFKATKDWLGASADADWMGRYYQCANRYAHLYFLTQIAGIWAFMVNVYFIDDPISRTTRKAWDPAIAAVKQGLGLSSEVPFSESVFLDAS
jgi:hypothetical protein